MERERNDKEGEGKGGGGKREEEGRLKLKKKVMNGRAWSQWQKHVIACTQAWPALLLSGPCGSRPGPEAACTQQIPQCT